MSVYTVKLVMLGNANVGKTSIVRRFVYSEHDAYPPTLGANFCAIMVPVPDSSDFVKFQVWDTAGQEIYRGLASLYYKDAAAAILVYDITNHDSFEGLKEWVNELKENEADNIIFAIASNKSDLLEEEKVEPSEARKYAENIGAILKYTSAKENTGINDIFLEIAAELHPHLKDKFKEGLVKDAQETEHAINPFKDARTPSINITKAAHEQTGLKKKKKGGCC